MEYPPASASQLHYHMRVDVLSAVDVSHGASKLQQHAGLVHHQGRLELAQFQQVAAENPAEAPRVRRVRRGRERKQQRTAFTRVCRPVYLFAVSRDVEEEAASLQNHQNQVSQQLLISYLGGLTVSQPGGCMLVCSSSPFHPLTFISALK